MQAVPSRSQHQALRRLTIEAGGYLAICEVHWGQSTSLSGELVTASDEIPFRHSRLLLRLGRWHM